MLSITERESRLQWWNESQAIIAFKGVLHNYKGAIGLIIISILTIVAVAAPLIAPYDPLELHPIDQFHTPSSRYIFGADEFGRDIFSRLIYGARISMAIGFFSIVGAMLLGVSTGLVAGYIGGRVDAIIMRLWDALLAFPALILSMGIVAVLGPGSINAMWAVTIVNIPVFSRLTRAATLVEMNKDYVLAARAMGATDLRIVLNNILPNCIMPLLVQMTVSIPTAILVEASLSFLGLGTQPPDPSWGTMLQSAQIYLRRAPWYGVFPGVAITLLILGLNFLGDSLQDVLDPSRQEMQ